VHDDLLHRRPALAAGLDREAAAVEAGLDREPLQLGDRVIGQGVVALEFRLERLQGVDDVGARAIPKLGLGGREREVHAGSVAQPATDGRRGRGARDAVGRSTGLVVACQLHVVEIEDLEADP
jgi:hypothetical protein